MDRFRSLGIVKSDLGFEVDKLEYFIQQVERYRQSLNWNKADLVKLFHEILPGFSHKETGKYLDAKM